MTDIHIIPNEEIQRSYRWRKIWLAYSIIVGLLMTTFLCLWLNEYFNKPSWIVGKGVQLTFDEDTNTYKTSVVDPKEIPYFPNPKFDRFDDPLVDPISNKTTLHKFRLKLNTFIASPPTGYAVSYKPYGWEKVTFTWVNDPNKHKHAVPKKEICSIVNEFYLMDRYPEDYKKAADTSWEDVEVLWPGQANQNNQ